MVRVGVLEDRGPLQGHSHALLLRRIEPVQSGLQIYRPTDLHTQHLRFERSDGAWKGTALMLNVGLLQSVNNALEGAWVCGGEGSGTGERTREGFSGGEGKGLWGRTGRRVS